MSLFHIRLASIPNLGLVSLGILVFYSFIWQASSLNCLQCNSLHDPKCKDGKLSARECADSLAEAKYCMKSVGKEVNGRGQFVFRSCSRNAADHNCTKQSRNSIIYHVCRTTCEEDGCNGANSIVSLINNRFFLAIVIAIFLALHCCLN